MVNNYVKNSILHPPVKKHYKKYHVAFLIVVVILKQCYSLTEISQMIQIYWDMNDQRINLHYDTFIRYFTNFLHEIMTTGNTPSNLERNISLASTYLKLRLKFLKLLQTSSSSLYLNNP